MALLLGAFAMGGWWWFSSDDGEPSTALRTTSTPPERDLADVDTFLRAFTASRVGVYRVEGHLVVTPPTAGGEPAGDGQPIEVLVVRRGADSIEIWGDTLIVTLGGRQQSCERIPGAGLGCAPALRAPNAEQEAAELRRHVAGADSEYDLYHDQPDCWQMIARMSPAPAQWGQTTTLCFDAESSAITRQVTTGPGGVRTFVADVVSSTVTDDDLVPPTQ